MITTPTPTDANAALPILREAMANLNESSRRFASDILSTYSRRGTVSHGQAPWVGKLIDRAQVQAADAAAPLDTVNTVKLGDTTGIKALFDRAAIHLKAPGVVIQVPDVGMVKVYVGKANTRWAGRTMVVDYDKDFPLAKTYGEIRTDGLFAPRKNVTTPSTLIPALQDFAANPVQHAAAYGRLTGKCCFCRNRLTDPRSTAQGYGPDCAEHYGLPWGEQPEAESVFLASDASPDQGDGLDLSNLEVPPPEPESAA